MFETNQFNLPLLQAAQAQKHITVNEAFARLDALAQLRIHSLTEILPPENPVDGMCYSVPVGANGVWHEQDGKLAIFSNGAWLFLSPKAGWKAWIIDRENEVIFDGSVWRNIWGGGIGELRGEFGSAMRFDVMDFEHIIEPGNTNATLVKVPAGALVLRIGYGVSQELIQSNGGTWRFGLSTSPSYYKDKINTNLGTTGIAGNNPAPRYYSSNTALSISPSSGEFISGRIVFALYMIHLTVPTI